MYHVEIGASVAAKAASFRDGRSSGHPDEYDFVAGPLAAAVVAFRDFDQLPAAAGPSVRLAVIVNPFFGAIAFTAVLVAEATVEIVEFEIDEEYWQTVDDDPDE